MNSSCKYFLFLCLLISGISNSQNKKGPVAKFSFNGAKDYDEVSKKKMKLVGADFTEDRFGNANSAVYLAGNPDSYLNLGNYPALKPREGTVSIWVMIELETPLGKGSPINPVILTKRIDAEDYYESYSIYYVLKSKRIEGGSSRDSLKQATIFSMQEFTPYEWHHLVISYDYNFLSFYVDGKITGRSFKNYETQFNPLDSVVVGTTASKKNARYFNGLVDDIEFYDRVLSADEVTALYHAPNPNKYRIFLNWILLALGFIALILLIYFYIRYRLSVTLKKEKQKLELDNIVLETELRVNRALMSPHFVFNSLNTLRSFILKNENDRANHYLIKFSKLMRSILESNMSDVITLEFEIELLTKYLEIEDLRFEENILHYIITEPDMIPSTIHIPIMMLQPFIENAIWHGLLKKKGEKILKISFSLVGEKYLQCIIDDNGIGRSTTGQDILQKKSLATGFVIQRLELLNKIHHLQCSLTIEDKPEHGGTLVKIILPILKK